MKKPVRLALGSLMVIIFLITLVAASVDQGKKYVKGEPIIHLNDENEFSFLQKKDIRSWLLQNKNLNLETMSINELDLKKIETIAEENPWVSRAEIYIDNQKRLHIDIIQRSPVARVFEKSGNSFYLDSTLHAMPISYGYTFPTVVFTNAKQFHSEKERKELWQKIVYLGKVIGKDSFWNAQISQIEVQDDQSFVASPLLGNQRIILGDTNNIEQKLSNLFAFYKNIANDVGWNTYQVYDLRFNNQIVASPTIGKSPPKLAIPPISDSSKIKEAMPEESLPKTNLASSSINPSRLVKPPDSKIKTQKEIPKVPDPVPKKKDAEVPKNQEQKPKYLYPGKEK